MKKIIFRTLLLSTLIFGVNVSYANNDAMFENTSSKDWAETPNNVKNALKNIKTMSGESSKDMMSTNWLKELNRSPSTYGLNQNDVAWVEGMINANKGKSTWNPKTKIAVNTKKEPQKTKETVAIADVKVDKKSEPVLAKVEPVKKEQPKKELVKKEDASINKEMVKIVEENKAKKTKAVSTPLPNPPAHYAKNETPDLTPVNLNKNVIKSDSLVKISDALIKINKKDNESVDKNNKELLLVLDETLKFEEINRKDILELQERNKLLNNISEMLAETKEPIQMNSDIEQLSQIVKSSGEDLNSIANSFNDQNEENLLINNDEAELKMPEIVSVKEVVSVQEEPKVEVKKEVVQPEELKVETVKNKNIIKEDHKEDNIKSWNLESKLELVFMLICFSVITLWFLSLLGFRRDKK